MALVVKIQPANAEDIRDTGSNPGSGRFPGGGNGNPLHYSWLENSMDRAVWWAKSLGSQRVKHNWARTHTKELVNNHTHSVSKHKETTPMELILDQWEKNIADNLSLSLPPKELSWYPLDHVTSSTTVLPTQSSLFSCQTMAHSILHPPDFAFFIPWLIPLFSLFCLSETSRFTISSNT